MNGDAAQCIALIGPSGVGKSTVGQQLAYELGWPFFDLDALIEDRAGQSVSAIFASEGEAGFRERESAALSEALDQGPAVLACGGGAVVRLFNRNLLRERAWCVYLSSTAPTLISRIRAAAAGQHRRPLVQRLGKRRRLALTEPRLPFAGENSAHRLTGPILDQRVEIKKRPT